MENKPWTLEDDMNKYGLDINNVIDRNKYYKYTENKRFEHAVIWGVKPKTMKINIKKLVPEAVIPTYAKAGDAGMDLTATSKSYDEYGNVVYGTGLAFEIPFGYVGLLFPRSSNSKKGLLLTNSVGVCDSGYRGEVSFKFKPSSFFENEGEDKIYEDYDIGDRIGQIIIIPYPQIEFNEVEELNESERGATGWGSSGN